MPRLKRPSLVSPCVADRHSGSGERIAEFTFPDGSGGLISLRTDREGRNIVEVYRADPSIIVARQP